MTSNIRYRHLTLAINSLHYNFISDSFAIRKFLLGSIVDAVLCVYIALFGQILCVCFFLMTHETFIRVNLWTILSISVISQSQWMENVMCQVHLI